MSLLEFERIVKKITKTIPIINLDRFIGYVKSNTKYAVSEIEFLALIQFQCLNQNGEVEFTQIQQFKDILDKFILKKGSDRLGKKSS